MNGPDSPEPEPGSKRWYDMNMLQKARRMHNRGLVHARRRLPVGTRLIVGLLVMVGGVFGFLPVLGFWMVPLGISIAALDVVPLYRRLRRHWETRERR